MQNLLLPRQRRQRLTSYLRPRDHIKEKPQEAEVVAVGPGRFSDEGDRIPVDVKVGDMVVFSKYGGTELKYNGQEYLVLSARDVLAIIER